MVWLVYTIMKPERFSVWSALPDMTRQIRRNFRQTILRGAYINKFLSSTLIPGSIFKLVTSAAAIENVDGLDNWTYTCTGTSYINGGTGDLRRRYGTRNCKL